MNPFRILTGNRYAATFTVALLIMAGVAVSFFITERELVRSAQLRVHTLEVLLELERLSSSLSDGQSRVRGMIVTGNTSFLGSDDELLAAGAHVRRLRDLTADNASQQKRLSALEDAVARFVTVMRASLQIRDTAGFEAAQRQVASGEGQRMIEGARVIIHEMQQEEHRLLAHRDARMADDLFRLRIVFVTGVIFASTLIIWASVLMSRTITQLRISMEKVRETEWIQTNLAKMAALMQGKRDQKELAQLILGKLAEVMSAQHGAFYLADQEKVGDEARLRLLAGYAVASDGQVATEWRLGQGLVGQCAQERKRILVKDLPADYIRVASSLGYTKPVTILLEPVIFENRLLAVIELASLNSFNAAQLTFMDGFAGGLGAVISLIQTNARTEQLLKESQTLTEELQAQQEEMQQINAELHSQTEALRSSQDQLRQQQSELELVNTDLEEKATQLELQRTSVASKNRELELTQSALTERAEQLALSSKYKSEFLANMSHELRTPLNSLLLLARLLGENKDGNLTPKQLQYAQTIYAGGNDLLGLINEILDLSRIEAGKMTINPVRMLLTGVKTSIEQVFQPLADQKSLHFHVRVEPSAPLEITTDSQRLDQILRNLLANAFKFTSQGSVTVEMSRAESISFESENLKRAEQVVAFAVRDTGIGIASEKQRIIWEAFQQGDGTTSRRFGGTGLGLTISREIARLLGGEIHLESAEGKGSTFTLYLPNNYVPLVSPDGMVAASAAPRKTPQAASSARSPQPAFRMEPPRDSSDGNGAMEVADDRFTIQAGDRLALVVDDDHRFSEIVRDLAREHGFKVLVASRGDVGLALAHEFKPNAIILDLKLPGLDGWTVLERLKRHPQLRHIPVHIISIEEERRRALQEGALAYLVKPVSQESLNNAFERIKSFSQRKVGRVLVVEDSALEREEIIKIITDHDAECIPAESGKEAIAALQEKKLDCVILDLNLPDMSGFDVLERMHTSLNLQDLPVVVYTGKSLDEAEEARLQRFVHAIVMKGPTAPARLLDETALFLHRVEGSLPKEKQKLLDQLHARDEVLAGKTVLIVDDDLRNIFATTSVLESHQMKVIFAENGKQALAQLAIHPEVEVVLMDIMMPEMDGYETMREIRKEPRQARLPIIALTARAMSGDREKCIAAGASDYLSKPVEMERLLSLLRVWLYQTAPRFVPA